MGGKLKYGAGTFGDILQLLEDTEAHYGIKVRLSINPKPRSGYSDGCILLVTPYTRTGGRLHEVQSEQLLFPSKTHRTIDGAWLYLINLLSSALDEWQHKAAREAQQAEAESLTPLEQYIARSFSSGPEALTRRTS